MTLTLRLTQLLALILTPALALTQPLNLCLNFFPPADYIACAVLELMLLIKFLHQEFSVHEFAL